MLSQLPKTTEKSPKRVGRGYGSGKGGHNSGRGAKGQKSRSKVPLYFEGTAMRKSLIRRMPMLRGKLRFKSFADEGIILNLKHLGLFKAGTTVDVAALVKAGIIPAKAAGLKIKILGDGEIKIALKISLPISKSAAKKVVKAGGEVLPAKTA